MSDHEDPIEPPASPPSQPESGDESAAPGSLARQLQLLALLDPSNLTHDLRSVTLAIRGSAWPEAAMSLREVARECREMERVAKELVRVFEGLEDESDIPF